MSKKNKILFFISILLSITCKVFAQHYKTAAGLRLGTEYGLTVQQYIGDKNTLEGIWASNDDSQTHNISLLGERHFNVMSRRVNFYFGGGAEAGLLKAKKGGYSNLLGITGIAGGELTFKRLNFSIDYKPSFYFSKGDLQDRTNGYIALSARYIIVEREKLGERIKKKFKRKS